MLIPFLPPSLQVLGTGEMASGPSRTPHKEERACCVQGQKK